MLTESEAGMKGDGQDEDEYFSSYFDLEVHKLMLRDAPRTNAYREAINSQSKDWIQGKAVLDVGAGTGILSLFCWKAGARVVYAVEASAMAKPLQEVVGANKAGDVIKVIQGKAEEVDLPERVDVLVSEWMGFYLLHESMLESVIAAREKHLKPDTGLLLPSHARVWCALCCRTTRSHGEDTRDAFSWDDVYGFDMSPLRAYEHRGAREPQIAVLKPEQVLTEPRILCELDLRWAEDTDLRLIEKRFFASMEKDGPLDALALWFDCTFNPLHDLENPVVLGTGPSCPETHWKQTLVPLTPPAGAGPEGRDDVFEEDDVVGWHLSIEKADGKGARGRRYNISVGLLDPATEEHPVPCDCKWAKCEVIKALLKKQEEEEEEEENAS